MNRFCTFIKDINDIESSISSNEITSKLFIFQYLKSKFQIKSFSHKSQILSSSFNEHANTNCISLEFQSEYHE